MIAPARAIHRGMREWEVVNAATFKKDNVVARILENDPDYEPYRKRAGAEAARPRVRAERRHRQADRGKSRHHRQRSESAKSRSTSPSAIGDASAT